MLPSECSRGLLWFQKVAAVSGAGPASPATKTNITWGGSKLAWHRLFLKHVLGASETPGVPTAGPPRLETDNLPSSLPLFAQPGFISEEVMI